MSVRELVVLGTGSQVPTRHRNHNGYLLRWDGEGLLFDPGEGTQRQMIFAGVSTTSVTRICLTHFHGDHCLGVPGVVQRLSLDRVPHTVRAHYPASGRDYFARLRHASIYHETAQLREEPVTGAEALVAVGPFGRLEARRLDHLVEAYGYRLVEPAGRRMLPDRLAAAGISGARIGELQRRGWLDGIDRAGRVHGAGRVDIADSAGRVDIADSAGRVDIADVSEVRPGQRFAFIMDTRLCDAVYALAEDADLLVIESTFLHSDAGLAADYGHLTARQAARVAAESGVRRLVLTHFSQRYTDPGRFAAEAAEEFSGDIVVASDLDRIPVPPRRQPGPRR